MANETVKIEFQEENEMSRTSGEVIPASGEINWQIEEGPKTSDNKEWFWALAIVGFAVVVFGVMLKNYLLIVIVALAAFIVFASKNKKPETHDFRLDSKGVTINGKPYHYENFESFWIFPDGEIAFRRKHHLMPLLIIPFHSHDETEIREILESRLSEIEEEESFLDLLRKKFF